VSDPRGAVGTAARLEGGVAHARSPLSWSTAAPVLRRRKTPPLRC